MNAGKCPGCGKVVRQARLEAVDIVESFQPRWKGISYCCVSCNTVLSVVIDQISIKTDIINSIKKLLGR